MTCVILELVTSSEAISMPGIAEDQKGDWSSIFLFNNDMNVPMFLGFLYYVFSHILRHSCCVKFVQIL